MPLNLLHHASVVGSVATSTLSAWRGTSVVKAAVQPPMALRLYDMEGSPHCRSVREALTALGLDAEIYPCPKGGKRYRPEVKRLGGKVQFPMLLPGHRHRRAAAAGGARPARHYQAQVEKTGAVAPVVEL